MIGIHHAGPSPPATLPAPGFLIRSDDRGGAGPGENPGPASRTDHRRARPADAWGRIPLGNQADVRSIAALQDFRAALAIYAEEALGALASAGSEAKRATQWVGHDRRDYWIDQVKRARERVSSARAEVSRRRMAQSAGSGSSFGEQKEILRAAEARLREAESKVVLVRKWEPVLAQAVLEMKAGTRRIGDLAGGDVARAIASLTRMVDALEAYLRESPPDGLAPALPAVAAQILAEAPGPELPDDEGPAGMPAPPSEAGGAGIPAGPIPDDPGPDHPPSDGEAATDG